MTAHAEIAPTVAFPRPSLARLSAVELRKMADTRAGFWLLLILELIVIVIVALTVIFGEADDKDLLPLFQGSVWVVSFLLPVLGILAVTSEWSQRTALTTFSLVPGRERVIAAKIVAGILFALAATGACLATAAVGNLFSGGSWSLELSELAYAGLFEVLSMLGGIAFGLAFLSSALAIVLYYVLPTAWLILGGTIRVLNDVAEWLETRQTTAQLLDTNAMTGGEWARLGTSAALWIGVLLIIGLVRLRRSELK